MMTMVLWVENDPFEAAGGTAAVAERMTSAVSTAIMDEQDRGILGAAARWVGAELDDLAAEVVLADPEADRAWRSRICSGYADEIADFASSLTGREVDVIELGTLRGLVTGGLSWGDEPTDTFGVWSRMFREPGDFDEDGNPYAELLFAEVFVAPRRSRSSRGVLDVVIGRSDRD